jgi:hypothetical protein
MSSVVKNIINRINPKAKIPAELQLATRRDIPDILELYYKEGWIDWSFDDFTFLFETSPTSCFKLVVDGKIVGVNMATLAGNEICYPHSNLISSDYRTTINYFDEAVKYNQYLETLGKLQVLYAARKVIRIYQSGGGFQPLFEYRRATVRAADPSIETQRVAEVQGDQWQSVFAYTVEIYKASRENLFRHFIPAGARGFAITQPSGRVEAFALVRKLPKGYCLGPVLADTEALARQVIAASLKEYQPNDLIIEGEEKKLGQTLANGFDFAWDENFMMKMYRGDAALLEDEGRLFGIFSRYIS